MPCATTARRVAAHAALGTTIAATVVSLVQRRRAKDAAEVRPRRTPEWPPLDRAGEPAT